MTHLRALLPQHRYLAVGLIAMALLMKVLIPVGFMPGTANGTIVVELCNGQGGGSMVIPGLGDKQDKGDHNKPESPCAFSGLSSPSLAATDPILPTIAIPFILALGVRAAPRVPVVRRAHMRPPLRGPPASI